ncbi:OmpA family protein [Mucilaginibacter sp. AW1-3]
MKRRLLILFLFIAQIAAAQNKAFKERADKAFDEKDYVTAAYYYDKALENKTSTTQGTVPYFSTRQNVYENEKMAGEITYRLAESYRLYHNLLQAELWYRYVIDKYVTVYPLSRYWYAVCLRSNKKIDDAIKSLELFLKTNKDKTYTELANKELENCLFAREQVKHPTLSSAAKMPDLNGQAGDFGLTVNNNQYWFTSSRSVNGSTKRINQIYVSDKNNPTKIARINLGYDAKKEVHYGPASLTASGKLMYFTMWYKEQEKTISAIYISKNSNQKWSAPQKLNNYVNAIGFNSMQPSVTDDGKRLFFASNQTGSIGGTDIWVSDLDADGLPINASNLGRTINTADDEQAPYYSIQEHTLYYSSKGLTGMGGFDLFESTDSLRNSWTKPLNLGYPLNSTKDDLYYYPDNRDSTIAYISSDRESECCINLFKAKIVKPKPLPPPTAILTGTVINCATGKPLPDVNITLLDSLTKQAINFVTDKTGKYNFKLTYKHTYSLRLEKKDYFAKYAPVPPVTTTKVDTLFNPVVCQQEYQINKPIVIDNILYDFNSYDLKPESKTVLDGLITILNDNPKIKVELGSHTDAVGTDRANNELSQDRAQECVNYIILKGIAPERIIAKGYGRQVPIAPNTLPNGQDNPEGRKLNRRTEFTVLSNE